MIPVSELTSAQLDYWTARADGVPAEQLTIRRVQRSTDFHVVRTDWGSHDMAQVRITPMNYSTDWAQGGPLIDKYTVDLDKIDGEWYAMAVSRWTKQAVADTPLQAICRAVVRAAFGDEVEEVGVCE